MKLSNPWNIVDEHLTRIQSGIIIGCVLMTQFFLCLYTGILSHHHILGTISALLGIVGTMFICMAIILKVFIFDYRNDEQPNSREVKD